jgi:Na+-translocating ferredoxin:NAD+ oxidoreductase RnfG subunit
MRHAILPLAALALMGAATSAFAVDYLTVAQAQSQLFPTAVQWADKTVALSAEQLTAVAKLGKVAARSAGWKLLLASDATGKYLGAVVVDQVVGKYELITYAVGVDAAGSVRGIEILSYRESHGSEIRLPAWRKQFVGKTTAAPLQTGNDIAVISGATLSCQHVTDGVRRIVAVISVLREASALPASP